MKKEKKKYMLCIGGYPLKDYLPILFLFSIFWAFGNIVTAIVDHNNWAMFSVFYLGICFSLYFYSNVSDKEDYKRDITRLNQEIGKLESLRESDKHIIELLKKELEQLQNTSQQD